jgi:hypothetical protein
LIGLAIVGGLTAGGVVALQSDRTDPSATVPETAAPPAEDEGAHAGESPSSAAAAAAAAAAAPAVEGATDSPVESVQPAPTGAAGPIPIRKHGKHAAPAARAEAPRSAADLVAEEASLLRAANGALARGDSSAALARLDEHAARFPHGALSAERQAARVFALCAAGRTAEARGAARAFLAAHPRSPLAAQVRRSCAEE